MNVTDKRPALSHGTSHVSYLRKYYRVISLYYIRSWVLQQLKSNKTMPWPLNIAEELWPRTRYISWHPKKQESRRYKNNANSIFQSQSSASLLSHCSRLNDKIALKATHWRICYTCWIQDMLWMTTMTSVLEQNGWKSQASRSVLSRLTKPTRIVLRNDWWKCCQLDLSN